MQLASGRRRRRRRVGGIEGGGVGWGEGAAGFGLHAVESEEAGVDEDSGGFLYLGVGGWVGGWVGEEVERLLFLGRGVAG